MTDDIIPGEVLASGDAVVLFGGEEPTTLVVCNDGDRPIQVGSHFHFADVNSALTFDRTAAQGKRLAVPAGTGIRFEPGLDRTVSLVRLRGRAIVRGLQVREVHTDES